MFMMILIINLPWECVLSQWNTWISSLRQRPLVFIANITAVCLSKSNISISFINDTTHNAAIGLGCQFSQKIQDAGL